MPKDCKNWLHSKGVKCSVQYCLIVINMNVIYVVSSYIIITSYLTTVSENMYNAILYRYVW